MKELRRSDFDPRPIPQFSAWLEDARRAGLVEPHACALATASSTGRPSARMVLLKSFDERGFVFSTNYESRKSTDLHANRAASLLFYWQQLGRQVRIEGQVAPTSPEESDALFAARPPEARMGSRVSQQSRVIPDRASLEQRLDELRNSRAPDLSRPAHWGGYRLAPDSIEFWLRREYRLHDRLQYTLQPDGDWKIARLAP